MVLYVTHLLFLTLSLCLLYQRPPMHHRARNAAAIVGPHVGGIAREHEMKALAVGGMEDHAHLLLSLPSSLAIAAAMRQIKSGSSRWMRESGQLPSFEWQEGYGAFSIGWAQVDTTVAYIGGQKEHHRKRDFQKEFTAILKKHRIAYDPEFVWG
jgi:REP element-mobilizing transposase RayT